MNNKLSAKEAKRLNDDETKEAEIHDYLVEQAEREWLEEIASNMPEVIRQLEKEDAEFYSEIEKNLMQIHDKHQGASK